MQVEVVLLFPWLHTLLLILPLLCMYGTIINFTVQKNVECWGRFCCSIYAYCHAAVIIMRLQSKKLADINMESEISQ